jgi:hypothetical protein
MPCRSNSPVPVAASSHGKKRGKNGKKPGPPVHHGPDRTRTERGTPRAGRNPLAQLRGGEGPFGRFEKFCEAVAVVWPVRA